MILIALHLIGDANLVVTMVSLSEFAGYTFDSLSAQVQFEQSLETWSLKDLTQLSALPLPLVLMSLTDTTLLNVN
jgi:hypothetical protein